MLAVFYKNGYIVSTCKFNHPTKNLLRKVF